MKKIYLLLSLLIICVSSLFAQAPEKFTYQAVVRNASNQLVINTQVGVRVNILQGTATGNAVYSESHVTSSNANGLVTVNIGGGSVLHGSFTGIDWSDGPYFLKTDIDPNGGNDYSITSTQQLLSVPYALYAKEAGNGFSGDYNDLTNTPQIPMVPTNVSAFTNDAGYITGYTETDPQFTAWDKDYNDLINKPAIPTVPTNVSAFTNDAGYITSAGIPAIPTVPTNVSAFTNDAGYITAAQVPAQVNADWNATAGAAQILNKPILFSGNYNDLTNKPTLFSGNYNDLTNKPTLFDGNYNSLTNRPNLAAVAISGSYNDLINKPSIPTAVGELTNNVGYITQAQVPAQVNADWNATSGAAQILNKPTLFSGNYNDLTNKPMLFSGNYNDLTNLPQIPQIPADISAFNNDAGYLTSYTETDPQFNAWDKNYNDLTNKPTIPTVPTNVSAFTNDAGYLTSFTEQQVLSISHDTLFLTGGSFVKLPAGFSGDYNDLTNLPQIPQIPADISAFNNDVGYITMDSIPAIPTVPTNVSAFTNDAGYLTGYTETDPQFNAWDKDYNDLTNKPTIPTVPTNVSAFNNDAGYITMDSVPTIPTNVGAFTNDVGYLTNYTETDPQFNAWDKDYNDLTNKPTIPTVPTNVSTFTNDAGYITMDSVPTIPTNVSAFTNDAGYITAANVQEAANIPTNVSAFVNDAGYLTSFTEQQMLSLSNDTIFLTGGSYIKLPASFDGDYNSLINQPEIPTVPTDVSAFNNDAGYITSADIPSVPTNVSQLNNDAGYITAAQCGDVDLCALANMVAQHQAQLEAMQSSLDSLREHNTPDLQSVPDGFPCPGMPTLIDYDNNVYNTVKIGEQCWMKENLRTQHYSDGTPIPLGEYDVFSTDNAYRYYPILSLGSSSPTAFTSYGCFYNWKAVMGNSASSDANPSGVQGVCPMGWHVPSVDEWVQLTDYVSSQSQYVCGNDNRNIAKALASTTDWLSSTELFATGNDPSLNNATGFSAIPVSYYSPGSTPPFSFSTSAVFWSATRGEGRGASYFIFDHNDPYTHIYFQGQDMERYGSSVRCVYGGDYLPSVITSSAEMSTATTALCGGTVTATGSSPVITRGVCWNTSPNPTVNNNHSTDGNGTGIFTSNISGLASGTIYYVRAYATNSVGTAYGEEMIITTTGTNDGASCPDSPTVTDYDGNVYNTVKIGNQCWMKENLRTTRFANGTPIALGDSTSLTMAYRYYPANNSANVGSYGYLYNRKAVMRNSTISSSSNPSGIQGICPIGWHVPSIAEWTQLTEYLSHQNQYVCDSNANSIAKALAATTGWDVSSNSCAVGNSQNTNNTSGFSALPAGIYSDYPNLGKSTVFSSTTQDCFSPEYLCSINIYNTWSNISISGGNSNNSFSVRCIRGDGLAMPIVNTGTVSGITYNSAICGGEVTDVGSSAVISRGVCWNISHNPTTNDAHTSDGNGAGVFTSTLIGLNSGITYYVRAYATNNEGTEYGEEISFTTNAAPADGSPCLGTATVTDFDGNVYNTVSIGNQCWMKENLKSKHYPDGEEIVVGNPDLIVNEPCRFNPGNDSSNVTTFGYLYNWLAAMHNSSSSNTSPSGVQGICPSGWHVPSEAEWNQLKEYLSGQSTFSCGGNSDNIAKSLASTAEWNSYNSDCSIGNNPNTNNVTGFTALPAGLFLSAKSSTETYDIHTRASFWSSTKYTASYAWYFFLTHRSVAFHSYYKPTEYGCSVRCLRDEASSGSNPSTATLPAVTTTAISDIIGNSASCGGNVTSNGGVMVTARGVCWSTSPNPTVSNSHTSDGSGTGSFTSNITGLTANTTYYVRAYATNSAGTAYGETVAFTTLSAGGTAIIDAKSCPEAQTVTDHEGNVYATVQIGNQCWMRDNLRTTTSPSTGTYLIPAAGTYETYTGKQARWYNNDSATYAPMNYGLLYNWNAAADTFNAAYGEISVNTDNSNALSVSFTGHRRGICPAGWHLPSDAEWNTMETTVSGSDWQTSHETSTGYRGNHAGKLAGGDNWTSSTTSGAPGDYDNADRNVSGFSAVPASCCYGSSFCGAGTYATFWSSTQNYSSTAYSRYLYCNYASVDRFYYGKTNGFSVRCLRDSGGGDGSSATLPTVITNTVSNITHTTATCGGNITSDGGASVTARGVCWSTSQNPTVSNSHTTDGTGTGSFTSNITGLTANTTYYVRAYAANSVGTAYGNEVSFTTLSAAVIDAKSCPGAQTVTDHEGNVYATVQIGEQCWMRDNLRTTTSPTTGTYLIPAANAYYTYTGKQARWYNNDPATYAPMNYGLLYNWNAAVDTFNAAYGETSINIIESNAVSVTFNGHRRGICPAGWHLPSDAEWAALTNYVGIQSEYQCGGNSSNIAKALASTEGWNNHTNSCAVGNGLSSNNAAGFSAVPAGECEDWSFGTAGNAAFFWSSTQVGSTPYYANNISLSHNNTYVEHYPLGEFRGISVRCLRD